MLHVLAPIACGPAWGDLVTNTCSNELALLGGSPYSFIKSRAILNFSMQQSRDILMLKAVVGACIPFPVLAKGLSFFFLRQKNGQQKDKKTQSSQVVLLPQIRGHQRRLQNYYARSVFAFTAEQSGLWFSHLLAHFFFFLTNLWQWIKQIH